MTPRSLALLVPFLLLLGVLTLPGSALVSTASAAPWHGVVVPAANSTSSSGPTVDGIACPQPAILVLGISFNCVSLLELTEAFVIMFTVVITLYIFKDADRAELPGEAASIPLTSDEELALRIQKDREDAADKDYREQVAKGGRP